VRPLATIVLLMIAAPSAALADTAADVRAKLDAAEARWNATAPGEYSFTVAYTTLVGTYGCSRQSYVVTAAGSRSLDDTSCQSKPNRLSSIPLLFRALRDQLDRPWTDVSAEFDSLRGLPVTFSASVAGAVDRSWSLRVTHFAVTSNPSLERP